MYSKSIGKTVGVTSTVRFNFVFLDKEAEKEDLVFSFVEIPTENGKIVARILDVKKQNLLLSLEQGGVLSKELLANIGDFSLPPERFEHAIADCEVVGLFKDDKLQQNRKPIPPANDVFPVSKEIIESIFYSEEAGHIPIGKIESFGSSSTPITLNGDELVTKHFAIFGMTGSGKTNTAAKLIEELAMRGYNMIIFDPHDDYRNITNLTGIYEYYENEYGIKRQKIVEAFEKFIPKDKIIPLLTTVSILYNLPIQQLLMVDDQNSFKFSEKLLNILKDHNKQDKIFKTDLFKYQDSNNCIKEYNVFPEVKNYGEGFEDLTLKIIEVFLNEKFTDAQSRNLSLILNQNKDSKSKGLTYIGEILSLIKTELNSARGYRASSLEALKSKFVTLKNRYKNVQKSASPGEIDLIAKEIISKQKNKEIIHRFSLSTLPEKFRKLLVFALTTYIFRVYKFGNVKKSDINPILFILEEARSLISARSSFETDFAGWLAVRSLRDLAYEGRKYGLAFGLISQKPSTIDAEVASQCNTILLHQLRSPDDQEYVKKVTEGLTTVELEMLKNIGTGKAVITGSGIHSTTLTEIYPRYSLEGVKKPRPLSESIETELIDIKESLKQPQKPT